MTRRPALVLAGGILLTAALAAGGGRPATQAHGTIRGTIDVYGIANDADAVVYIQKAPGAFAPQHEEMDQHDMVFKPHVLPVVVGSTVTFLNHDPVPHNVFSPDYERYNLGTWKSGLTKSYTFSTCRVVPCAYVQLCRLHENMLAYVLVLQNPYFAVTDASGSYTIKEVPAGSYTLAVWYPGKGAEPRTITVGSGSTVTENFSVKP